MGAVLGSPSPPLQCSHELLPFPSYPSGVCCSPDSQGIVLLSRPDACKNGTSGGLVTFAKLQNGVGRLLLGRGRLIYALVLCIECERILM